MSKRIDWEAQLGRRLRLRDLHAFFTVVHCGSMGRAAVQLGVSQPAISKIIADLEHALSVPLFDRNRRGIEPTIYGQALLRRGLVAFDELKQSIRDIEFLADPTTGEVRIGCTESIAATILPQIMRRFSEKYPGVVLHMDTRPSLTFKDPGLRDRKYDLTFTRLRMPLPDDHLMDDLKVEFLFDDPLIVAAGKHSRWARHRKLKLGQLINDPWILAPPDTWNHAGLAAAFRALGLDMPKASMVTVSMPLVTNFLANGPFITAFPRSVVSLNSLQELSVDMPVRAWPVVILTMKNRTLSPVVERFVECAREVTKSIIGTPLNRATRRRKPNVA